MTGLKAFSATDLYYENRISIKTKGEHKKIFGDTLTRKELLERMKKVISNELSVKPEKITMQSSYANDFKADDLDSVQLVMAFEDEFKIKIPEKDAASMATVQTTYNYLIRRLKIKK
jgi:acyl carrier protein